MNYKKCFKKLKLINFGHGWMKGGREGCIDGWREGERDGQMDG